MQKEEATVADSLGFKHPVSLTTCEEFQHFLSICVSHYLCVNLTIIRAMRDVVL